MSYGVLTTRPCPGCGTDLGYVDYEKDPPPIPPHPRTGSYASYNRWTSDDGESWLVECPECEEPLP